MKPIFLACAMLLTTAAFAQNCLSGRPILRDSLPCMEKALSLDGVDIRGKSIDEVVNIMCDYSPFARGSNVLVYIEHMEGSTVTTLFEFKDGKCDRSVVSISYSLEYISKRDKDVGRFMSRFNESYNPRYNRWDQSQYTRRDELRAVYLWEDAYSFVQLSVTEARNNSTVEIIRRYN
jgi:hypothetical protein